MVNDKMVNIFMFYKLIRYNQVGNAVYGKLFRTSHYYNLRTGQTTERLHFICDTLENADHLILPLIYPVTVTMSPKFKRLLPAINQVPGFNDTRLIGAPNTNQRSVCGGESGGNDALYVAKRHPLASFAERGGIRIHRGTRPEHSHGCILVSPENEAALTARFRAEQSANEETRLEICDR